MSNDRAPIVYLPDGPPVRVRLIGATCEGDVSGEGHFGYYPDDLNGEQPAVYFEDTPSVECVYCGREIAHEHIDNHHREWHPTKRWDPLFYQEIYDTDTDQ